MPWRKANLRFGGKSLKFYPMKKGILVHAGWALAAFGAFMIGLKSSSPPAEETSEILSRQKSNRFSTPSYDRYDTESSRDHRGRTEHLAPGAIQTLFGCYNIERTGIDGLIQQAIKDPSPITRQLALARILENMNTENVWEIRGQMLALSPDDRTWDQFNYAFGALAGRTAFDFASDSEESDLGSVISGWAAAQPQEALAAFDNLPEELQEDRARLERYLVAGIADRDIDLATTTALELGNGEEENRGQINRLMRTVANEALRTGDVQSASEWVASLPAGSARGAAMRRVSEDFVRENPAEAAQWAARFASEDYASSAIGEIGDEWAESDPGAAVAWLESLPEGNAQNRGFSEALGEWEDNDPEAASAYLNNMRDSTQRDSAISGFASGYAWQDPQASIAWAEQISDPAVRKRTLIRVGHAFHRRDPDKARTWLQNSELSAKQQQQAMLGRR